MPTPEVFCPPLLVATLQPGMLPTAKPEPSSGREPCGDSWTAPHAHLQEWFAFFVLIFTVQLDVQFFNQFCCLLFLKIHDSIKYLIGSLGTY